MAALLDFFANFWEIFTSQEVASMTGLQVVVLAFIIYALFGLLKNGVNYGKQGVKVVVKTGSDIVHFNKAHASRINCIHCGRTLDKCVCANNKGVSYGKRIRKQKKEQKLLRKLGKN